MSKLIAFSWLPFSSGLLDENSSKCPDLRQVNKYELSFDPDNLLKH